MAESRRWNAHIRKPLLSIGFLGFAIGVVFAWTTPSTGYEVSIYQGTPLAFWIGMAVAMGSAAVVCTVSARDRVAGLAVILGWLTTVAIAGLPVIRNYAFYGVGDSLTHLGWAKDLRTGLLSFPDLFYPGSHSSAIILADATGLSTMRGMIFFIAILTALFALFIPLIVRGLVESSRATVIAAFAGFMLLPINNVSSWLMFHTYSIGMLTFPLVLYLIVKVLRSDPVRGSRLRTLGGWNGLLAIAGGTLLLTHPQVMLNVLILLGTIVFVRGFVARLWPNHRLTAVRSMTGIFLLLLIAWIAWTTNHWQLFVVGNSVYESAINTVAGTEVPGQTVQDTGEAGESIGVPLATFFIRLFLVPAIFTVVAVCVVLGASRIRTIVTQPRTHAIVTYAGLAALVLGPFFLLHFLGDVSQYFFRHLGFTMVVVTVLGSIGIDHLAAHWGDLAKPVGLWLLAIAMVMSVIVVFPSPYVFLPSHHVSEQHVSGYQTAIDNRGEGIGWTGIREGPGREFDAFAPGDRPRESRGQSTSNDAELAPILRGEADRDLYLGVTGIDHDREVEAYLEIRYSSNTIRSIGDEPPVHHVQTNGEFDLYYIPGTGDVVPGEPIEEQDAEMIGE